MTCDAILDALGHEACVKPPVRFDPISTWAPDFVSAVRRHYTKSAGAPYGKKLAWRIWERDTKHRCSCIVKDDLCVCGAWTLVGYIGLGEPSFKLAPRRRLGLSDARPLPETVCCFIFRLEGPRRISAHRVLRAWHPLAAEAWRLRYGWTPVHWETMVGQGDARNPGACFRRAGYRKLGLTTGRTARRPAGNTHGPRVWSDSTPKLVLYRGPLARLPEVA